jgi:FAD/FMN-containing dehydrogenase
MSKLILNKLKSVVGSNGWITSKNELTPYITEWRDILEGNPLIVLLPNSTKEVSDIIKICAYHKIAIVPQGGNTGLCGGAIPDKSGKQVIISLKNLNRIRKLIKDEHVVVLEAGCILSKIHEKMERNNLSFPIDMSSSGSCQIGGNISTNAGGTNVLKYGTLRAQVLGLEVVLPSGEIWNGISRLKKDTAGYDLKQLFIGAEGTLGVITAASLKVYPSPKEIKTALIAIQEPSSINHLLYTLRTKYENNIETLELISNRAMRYVIRHIPSTENPFDDYFPWYILLEISNTEIDEFNSELMGYLESGYIDNAIVAKNIREKQSLWRIRHSISEAQKKEGASIKHDISVPISSIIEFIIKAEQKVHELLPSAKVVSFGHVGDGGVHFNVTQPKDLPIEQFDDYRKKISSSVYDCAKHFNGSISAEHGIGIFKKEDLIKYKSNLEIDLMRKIKASIDPDNIMNPGKIF